MSTDTFIKIPKIMMQILCAGLHDMRYVFHHAVKRQMHAIRTISAQKFKRPVIRTILGQKCKTPVIRTIWGQNPNKRPVTIRTMWGQKARSQTHPLFLTKPN